jgi:large subunit ribosomal protein L25
MEKILVKADKRPEIGKGSARSLRRQGVLPAVVYSGGNSMPIKMNLKEMSRLMSSGVGEHALITIELNEDGSTSEHPALVKDYQADPVSSELLHVDFMEVSLEQQVTVTVALDIVKEPRGIKLGGIMEHRMREVEVECLPTQIPEKIEVDAESVDIGFTLHVSDLTPPEGIKIVSDPKEVILNVSAPRVEEVAPAEEAVEEGAEEPELVKAKGKEEEAKEAETEEKKE